MPPSETNRLCNLEEGHQEPRESQDLLEAELFGAAMEEAMSPSPSSSSYPSVVFPDSPEGVATPVTPSPQSPRGACPSPAAITTPPLSPTQGAGPSSQGVEQQSPTEDPEHTESSLHPDVNLKMCELVLFLLLKYCTKEPTMKAKMLSSVIKEDQDLFPDTFSRASECMRLLFGMDVKGVDPSDHSYVLYVLVNTLGLTYDGMGSDEHSMPRNGLLVMLLCVNLVDGECTPEKNCGKR